MVETAREVSERGEPERESILPPGRDSNRPLTARHSGVFGNPMTVVSASRSGSPPSPYRQRDGGGQKARKCPHVTEPTLVAPGSPIVFRSKAHNRLESPELPVT